jgi:hypothetical protein
VMAADYVQQADNGEYLVHDSKTPHAGILRVHGKGSPKGTLNHTVSFFPLLNIADPEDDEKEPETPTVPSIRKDSSERGRISVDSFKTSDARDSVPSSPISPTTNGSAPGPMAENSVVNALEAGEKEQVETTEEKKLPKIRLSPEELVKYESGLIIFKILDVELAHKDVRVEVVMDDMAFPSYQSSTIRSRNLRLDEIGDCFVRELDFSNITLRLRDKDTHAGDNKKDQTIAKLTGSTLETLKQCLVRTSSLS